jgi:chemotaxis protein CheC
MLTAKQKDTITEIVNIGVGRGSASLSQMLNSEILLNVPYINVISFDRVMEELEQLDTSNVHSVELSFSGEYDGNANIILSEDSALKLASLLMHEEPTSDKLKEMKEPTIPEVGNIILNAIMGTFGNILDAPLDYHMPRSYQGDITGLYHQLDKEKFSTVLICRTNFSVEGKGISGEILIMYEINSFNRLKDVLDKMGE